MATFADKVIKFNKKLDYDGVLPDGINIMNPFREDANVLPVSSAFYKKYYEDNQSRYAILGINPGRFGGGITGIPFTDPKNLRSQCQIDFPGKDAHEPSSVFVYDVIHAYGTVADFYQRFYFNSLCPLGFTISDDHGRVKNYNYYDSKELTHAVHDFMVSSIKKQITMGLHTDICFCMGVKNAAYLHVLNDAYHFFDRIITLEHPRFIMQYKQKTKQLYIAKYLAAFSEIK